MAVYLNGNLDQGNGKVSWTVILDEENTSENEDELGEQLNSLAVNMLRQRGCEMERVWLVKLVLIALTEGVYSEEFV